LDELNSTEPESRYFNLTQEERNMNRIKGFGTGALAVAGLLFVLRPALAADAGTSAGTSAGSSGDVNTGTKAGADTNAGTESGSTGTTTAQTHHKHHHHHGQKSTSGSSMSGEEGKAGSDADTTMPSGAGAGTTGDTTK
jgi:hypothetical protein